MSTVPIDPAPTSPATEAEDDRAESLQRRLASSLVRLRSRAADPAQLDRHIALAGGLMVAAGIVLVLLGWYGAAHTSRLYLQVPYLISGGLLGVVLAFGGGCAFLASWLTRLVHEERARGDAALAVARDTAASLVRIEALLAATVPRAGTDLGEDDLVATPSGRLAHRRTCPTVAGRTDLRRVALDADDVAPCRMCDAGAA